MNSDTMNSSDSSCIIIGVYDTRFFFRGQRIACDNEPPAKFIDAFLDLFTMGVAHPGWDKSTNSQKVHKCNEGCRIEACMIWGRPYVNSVVEAFDW